MRMPTPGSGFRLSAATPRRSQEPVARRGRADDCTGKGAGEAEADIGGAVHMRGDAPAHRAVLMGGEEREIVRRFEERVGFRGQEAFQVAPHGGDIGRVAIDREGRGEEGRTGPG